MRKALLFMAILAPSLGSAQISSRITHQDQLPDHIRFNPQGQQPEEMPRTSTASPTLTMSQVNLMTAQTNAIKDLTARIEKLEKRVESLEESRKKGGAK